jgi:molecular chaperone GrpE
MQHEEIDNTEHQEDQNANPEEHISTDEFAENIEESADQQSSLTRERDEWKDKYLRLFAEFDNYKKRTQREKAEWFREAKSDVISVLLTVLDDFDRAKTANQDSQDAEALKEGFELIYNKLYHVLEAKGLKPMNSMHQEFNTDQHEAITNIPAPDKKLIGKVVDVVEKGYTLNDHIIRYAKVVVGQ